MQPQEPTPQPTPAAPQDASTPHPMYYSRPIEPVAPVIPSDIQEKHEESQRRYPHLNLSEGEYVITDVTRHPIGLIRIWFFILLGVLAVLVSLFLLSSNNTTTGSFLTSGLDATTTGVVAIVTVMVALVIGYLATFVYTENHMYLTNESVIQNIQITPFAKRQQTVSLTNIEDASYAKPGILSMIFDYGEIRLSTEGEETTYRFNFAIHPEKQVALLNNAVESFKHGRPVHGEN